MLEIRYCLNVHHGLAILQFWSLCAIILYFANNLTNIPLYVNDPKTVACWHILVLPKSKKKSRTDKSHDLSGKNRNPCCEMIRSPNLSICKARWLYTRDGESFLRRSRYLNLEIINRQHIWSFLCSSRSFTYIIHH